jgi:hypothetical protein
VPHYVWCGEIPTAPLKETVKRNDITAPMPQAERRETLLRRGHHGNQVLGRIGVGGNA